MDRRGDRAMPGEPGRRDSDPDIAGEFFVKLDEPAREALTVKLPAAWTPAATDDRFGAGRVDRGEAISAL